MQNLNKWNASNITNHYTVIKSRQVHWAKITHIQLIWYQTFANLFEISFSSQ